MSEVGTRSAGRGARTRHKILDLAVRRFADQGFRDTSVSAVARDLRLTPSTVYAHFGDKEQLFVEAFEYDTNALIDEVLGAQGPPGPSWRLLPRVWQALPSHPLTRRVLEGKEPDLVPRLFDLASARRLRQQIADQIRRGQEAGFVRGDIDADVIATGLETIIVATLLAAVQAQVIGDEERRDGILAVVWAALGAPVEPPASD